MKNWVLLLGVFWCVGLSAQNYQEFTKEERTLIEGRPDQMMRVFNLNQTTDSLILKSASIPVDPNHKLTHLLAERMLATVQNPDHLGVGIAAPQVGINRRMVVVQRFDKPDYPFEVFINPEIIWASELMQEGPEGDLSFEARGMVKRHYAIQIRYQDLKGETKIENLEGFTAVIYQHERDHLDGILLTDRLSMQEKQTFETRTYLIEPKQ